ncbi:hypothetical protein BpHYR1_015943 [Brachionus plicatilis]|uniref:Uncharacterized protein n=1 Tax=Brachionus plicatilis TaxID=10195 RepID=A0A3M7QFA5_BRAPC|nr:hypothetical protein BpHYR1_015943 [Brachionus plicatilis]
MLNGLRIGFFSSGLMHTPNAWTKNFSLAELVTSNRMANLWFPGFSGHQLNVLVVGDDQVQVELLWLILGGLVNGASVKMFSSSSSSFFDLGCFFAGDIENTRPCELATQSVIFLHYIQWSIFKSALDKTKYGGIRKQIRKSIKKLSNTVPYLPSFLNIISENLIYSGFNKNVTQKKPRPNNGQHGRPSRPVYGSEPADLGDQPTRPVYFF